MGKKDPRVDAYIARSADFAKPILAHLRRLIHDTCPTVEETIKWGMPHFEYKSPGEKKPRVEEAGHRDRVDVRGKAPSLEVHERVERLLQTRLHGPIAPAEVSLKSELRSLYFHDERPKGECYGPTCIAVDSSRRARRCAIG